MPAFPVAVSTDGTLEFIVDTTGQVWLLGDPALETWGTVDAAMTSLALGDGWFTPTEDDLGNR
jgi:hypothetical protein